ncbi:hypothetical protein Ait01nite_071770 [Actinoplanes italicus]|nr:hypothetical protein Ait01nite_071770 [Actinoplanes italicus]
MVATKRSPQSTKRSVAGYFECVLLQSTFEASTGKAYFTFVFADSLAFGFALALALVLTEGLAAALVAAGGCARAEADSALAALATGSTNWGVEAGDPDPLAPPQPARHTAAIVRPERLRSKRTAPSWQKTADRADLHRWLGCW